jgi:LysR family transcriptional regulator, glycine cleavage system transcriptional activator
MPAFLPSLNGLQVFEAAARHLSFTRAAAELNVTQTAVSHQIRRLEEQLNTRLFIRRNRALTLTPEARAFLVAVSGAFRDLRDATADLLRGAKNEVVTVSATASVAAKWLVPRLAAFHEAHPETEVRLSTGTRLVDFRREDVDLAIRFGRGHWPGLHAEWLMAEEIFPVCAPALLTGPHPLTRPEDLIHHTLLQVDLTYDEWQLWLTAAGLPAGLARRAMRFDDRLLALQAAMDGLGVAIGHLAVVAGDIASGRLVVPFGAHQLPAEAGYYVVGPTETVSVPKIARFREWLLAVARTDGLAARPAP